MSIASTSKIIGIKSSLAWERQVLGELLSELSKMSIEERRKFGLQLPYSLISKIHPTINEMLHKEHLNTEGSDHAVKS